MYCARDATSRIPLREGRDLRLSPGLLEHFLAYQPRQRSVDVQRLNPGMRYIRQSSPSTPKLTRNRGCTIRITAVIRSNGKHVLKILPLESSVQTDC